MLGFFYFTKFWIKHASTVTKHWDGNPTELEAEIAVLRARAMLAYGKFALLLAYTMSAHLLQPKPACKHTSHLFLYGDIVFRSYSYAVLSSHELNTVSYASSI